MSVLNDCSTQRVDLQKYSSNRTGQETYLVKLSDPDPVSDIMLINDPHVVPDATPPRVT